MREEMDYDRVTKRLVPGLNAGIKLAEQHEKMQSFKPALIDLIDIDAGSDNTLLPGLEFVMERANVYFKLKDLKAEIEGARKLAACQQDPPT